MPRPPRRFRPIQHHGKGVAHVPVARHKPTASLLGAVLALPALGIAKSGRLRSDEMPVSVVDVATRLVRRLHLRTMVEEVDAGELVMRMQRAQRALADAGSAPENEAVVAAKSVEIPKQFENGLPVRDQTGMQVVWVEFVLRDHGKAAPVVLDDAQKALLGR